MSDKSTNPTVHTVTSLGENDTQVGDKKLSIVAKTRTFLKTHKKTTIAMVGLGALVGVSAFTGRKTATVTLHAQSPLVLEDASVYEGEVVENDTTVA